MLSTLLVRTNSTTEQRGQRRPSASVAEFVVPSKRSVSGSYLSAPSPGSSSPALRQDPASLPTFHDNGKDLSSTTKKKNSTSLGIGGLLTTGPSSGADLVFYSVIRFVWTLHL